MHDTDAAGIRALIEKDRIRDLLARLARAVDRVHEEGIRECYIEDSWDDHGESQGTGAQFAARTERFLPENRSSAHILGQSLIDLRGDEALCETYFIGPLLRVMDGELMEAMTWGRYLDRVVKVDGQWLIAYRRVVLEGTTLRSADQWPGIKEFTRGARWPDDDVYHPERLTRS